MKIYFIIFTFSVMTFARAGSHYSQEELDLVASKLINYLTDPDYYERDLLNESEDIIQEIHEITGDNRFGYFSELIQNQSSRFQEIITDLSQTISNKIEPLVEGGDIDESLFELRYLVFEEALKSHAHQNAKYIRADRWFFAGVFLIATYGLLRGAVKTQINEVMVGTSRVATSKTTSIKGITLNKSFPPYMQGQLKGHRMVGPITQNSSSSMTTFTSTYELTGTRLVIEMGALSMGGVLFYTAVDSNPITLKRIEE